MINRLPLIGWMLSFIGATSLSIPFYFIWNGLAPIYFSWLPEVYHNIPFWHCVGLFIIIPIIKQTLTPQFVKVNNTCLRTDPSQEEGND